MSTLSSTSDAHRGYVAVPNSAAARGTAVRLTAHLPASLDEVVLDFRAADYIAPGFCDELIRQVAERRGARVIRVPGVSESQHGYLARALKLRACDGRLVA